MHEWRTEPLERIAEIRSSNVDKKTNPGEEPVRLCNYMDVYSREYITEDIEFMEATATPAEIQRFGIERGDVMITKDSETPDDIGIPTVVVDDIPKLVCGYHVALIKPNRAEVDPLYLAKQLGLADTGRYYGRLANGSTRYGLSYQSIARTPIHLAPLPQQQRIAEILTTVDEAIEQTEALIAKAQWIKAGLMHDLFTRGVTSDGQLRPTLVEAPQLYKESPLGWIPKEWELSDAASEFDITSGVTLGPHRRPTKNPHPYLRVANVYAEKLELHDVAFLEAGPDLPGKMLAANDLLVVEGHANPEEIGRCALATSEVEGFTFQNHLFRLRARRISPGLAVRWMNGSAVRSYWLRTCSTSSGLNTINRTKLGAVPVVVPPPDEQDSVCAILDQVSAEIGVNIDHGDKIRKVKAGLMQDLLTGRVPVAVETTPTAKEVAANV
jgi:type I restriction enzyme S subunit